MLQSDVYLIMSMGFYLIDLLTADILILSRKLMNWPVLNRQDLWAYMKTTYNNEDLGAEVWYICLVCMSSWVPVPKWKKDTKSYGWEIKEILALVLDLIWK